MNCLFKMFSCIFIISTMVVFSTGKSLESIAIVNDTSTQETELNLNRTVSGEKIIFPDTFAKDKSNIKTRSSTENCLYNICEDVDDYPEQYIKDLVRNSPTLHGFFDDPVSIANRINDDTEDNGLCETIVKTVFPKKAVNKDNIEKFIINDDENRQGIITEQCKEKDCRYDNLFTSVGYKAGCEQKFTVRRLMALNDTGAAWDSFDMPSCCVCVVKKIKNGN